jgi:hypothetical protein
MSRDGVRIAEHGLIRGQDFHLMQHGVRDFEFAEPIILRGLRKKWDTCRIANLVAWLYERNR